MRGKRLREEEGGRRQCPLIDIEVGVVQRKTGVRSGERADAEEGARDTGDIMREVLRAHAWPRNVENGPVPEFVAYGVLEMVDDPVIVKDGRRTVVEFHVGRGAVHSSDVVSQARHPLDERLTILRNGGPKRTAEIYFRRDDVISVAGSEAAYRQDRRISGIRDSPDKLVHGIADLNRYPDGVRRFLRSG